MHEAFGTVVWVVCIVAIVIAVVALARSGRTWAELGRDRLVMDRDEPAAGPAGVDPGEREADIRALLAARNARRARRGEEPLDIDAELARLTGGETGAEAPAGTGASAGGDPALREEVRQLVLARNHRRVRAGQPALDVEEEVERELRRVRDLQ